MRRNDSSSSSKLSAQHDYDFSSTEDFLQDNTEPDGDSFTDYSPFMLVSELSNSLTGLDQAVKTYSFMVSEDQVPIIQVESPQPALEPNTSSDLLQMSSAFSSFESEEEEEEEKEGGWGEIEGLVSYPSGDMDNFATGILDAFESNLIKLKTQSLPDVFQTSEEYKVDVSSDVSPLTSTSNSITSIVESIDPLDSSSSLQRVTHSAYPRTDPLADHKMYDPSSPLRSNRTMAVETTEVEWMVGEVHEKRRLVPLSADVERKTTAYKMNGARGAKHNRMCSGDSLGTCSLAGSEFSEREMSGFSSPIPTTCTRLPVIANGFFGGEHGIHNGREHIRISRGDSSPLEEMTKRMSRISVTSSEAHK